MRHPDQYALVFLERRPHRIEFVLPARPNMKSRTVRQQLWARRIDLPAGKGKTVSVTCVVARECDAPAGVKPIEWRLLSNREASTCAQVLELINWYRCRWEIEILFDVLKNACRVEALQLGTMECWRPCWVRQCKSQRRQLAFFLFGHTCTKIVLIIASAAWRCPLPVWARALRIK